MQYHIYNTGDQVWTSIRYGKRVSVKVVSHDGIFWSEENNLLTRLKGLDLVVHKLFIWFYINFIYKITS